MLSGSRKVDVRLALDQRLGARDAAFARSQQQRREPARRAILRTRLGGDLARPLAESSERAFTSAPCLMRSCTISGWLCAAAHMSAVWPRHCSRALTLAPCFEQHLRRIDAVGARHGHERGLAFAIRRFHVRAGLRAAA